MNKVIVMGRLTADPTVRSTQDGKSIASFTLAVDRKVAKGAEGQQADFIRFNAWEKKAEFAEKYLRKGTKILITGRIRTDSYQDRQTGKKVYTTDVVVEDYDFCESKKDAGNAAASQDDGFAPVPDDDLDLPFN